MGEAAARRTALQSTFEDILGSKNVYYQPPESVKLTYPAIVYSKNTRNTTFADDVPYVTKRSYTVTLIYTDPDSELPDKLSALPKCGFERNFVSDNLYHEVYVIYE